MFKQLVAAAAVALSLGAVSTPAQAATTTVNAITDTTLDARFRVKTTDTQAQRIAKAEAYARTLNGGGVVKVQNNSNSDYTVRTYWDNDCDSFTRSELLSPGEWSDFGHTQDSFKQKPQRKTFQSYWMITTYTGVNQTKCVPLYPSPTTMIKIVYWPGR